MAEAPRFVELHSIYGETVAVVPDNICSIQPLTKPPGEGGPCPGTSRIYLVDRTSLDVQGAVSSVLRTLRGNHHAPPVPPAR